ncbi:MAG TPA: hypothetical protein VL048_05830 [Xanthobacteraceae bacterium]|nr:hypothetical protein [Xanthobacteraceae bacterium]
MSQSASESARLTATKLAGRAMSHRLVEVTLIENSTAGKPPRKFAGQTCDIEFGVTHWEPSADSPPSFALQPTTILWHEGKAEWFGRNVATGLMAVTNVRIVASDGTTLIDDWELITNPGVPRDVGNGVKFSVLQPTP